MDFDEEIIGLERRGCSALCSMFSSESLKQFVGRSCNTVKAPQQDDLTVQVICLHLPAATSKALPG
jgi:hypothetical protein